MESSSFTRVLVLGHTGYIGSRLLRVLQHAHPQLRVIGRSVGELDLARGDSAPALEALIDAKTAVVICAAIKKQLGDSPEVFSQNLAMITNVGKALETRRPGRVVFFSSAAVYGEDIGRPESIDEHTPVQPTSYYGIGKYAAERLLLRMAGTNTQLLMVRPALVYGPDEPGYYYGPSGFLRKTLRREAITLWGDGEELREFLYVDDVVSVVRELIFHPISGVLNIVSGTSYTYRQALDEIRAIAGESPLVSSKPRTKEKVDHRFDAGTLRRALPEFAFTTLSEGLRRVLQRERATAAEQTPA